MEKEFSVQSWMTVSSVSSELRRGEDVRRNLRSAGGIERIQNRVIFISSIGILQRQK